MQTANTFCQQIPVLYLYFLIALLNVEIYTISTWVLDIPLTHSSEHHGSVQLVCEREDEMSKTLAVWEHFKLSDDETSSVANMQFETGLPWWHKHGKNHLNAVSRLLFDSVSNEDHTSKQI